MPHVSTDDEAFDLTGVLKNPILTLSLDYVLILEWLFEDDEKTGAELSQKLSSTISPERVEYVQCRSRAEVETQLARALHAVPARGIPIVHIETHGAAASEEQPPSGFVGPDKHGNPELLEWERLGDILRPLNIATRFNLLVVGAACYGEGLMLGAPGGKPMPFVSVVGYTDAVSPMSIRHSLIHLYRELLLSKHELGLAVEAADRQRFNADDATLRPTSMVVLLAESFITGTAHGVARARQLFPLGNTTTPRTGLASLSPRALEFLRVGLESAWSLMWMQKDIPENAKRFAIDSDRLIELAVDYADSH
jgi:hypothetical protein